MNLSLYALIRVVLLQRKSVSLKFFGTVGEIEPLAKKGAAGKNTHYRADFSPGSVTDVSNLIYLLSLLFSSSSNIDQRSAAEETVPCLFSLPNLVTYHKYHEYHVVLPFNPILRIILYIYQALFYTSFHALFYVFYQA